MTTTVQPITIIKAATDPVPPARPRSLTPADFIEVDPRGEALFDAPCIDCALPVSIAPQLVEKNDDGEFPLVAPLCVEHQEVRETWAAFDEQHQAEMARRRERAAQPTFFSIARQAAMNGVPVTVVAKPSEGSARTRKAKVEDPVDAYMALGLSRSAAEQLVAS